MGYPFDRVISAERLQDFAENYTNMQTAEVNILFDSKTVEDSKTT